MVTWSSYQNRIFEYACSPSGGSFVVSSVAGSGKTTTAIECAKRISAYNQNARILFLAFNKSIADKLEEQTEGIENIKCSTIHSLGLGVLYRSKLTLNVNDNKYRAWIRKTTDKFISKDAANDYKKRFIWQSNCENLLRLARINLIKSKDADGLNMLIQKHHIVPVSNEAEAVSKMLKFARSLVMFRSSDAAGYDVDYTDMITLPLEEGFRKFIPKYDVVFIDEAQDLSLAQQELMLQTVRPITGKFIAVGDPRQAISGFAGAMSDSFYRLEEKANGIMLPLTVNYRCGQKIISAAQKIVPEIQACDDAGSGEIIKVSNLLNVSGGDMIICRKTAPLVTVAMKLIASGKSCYIKGRDVEKQMLDVIEQIIRNGKIQSLGELYLKLDELVENLKSRIIENNPEEDVNENQAVVSLCEIINPIKTIAGRCQNIDELQDIISRLFDDKESGNSIMLSTVHKAKGLEAENVFIICPELLPYRYNGQQQWEFEQEINLTYVAITRAKNRLYYVAVEEKDIAEIRC